MRARRIGAKRARGGTSPAGPLRVYREIECPRTKATFRRYRSPGRFAYVAPDISLRPPAYHPFCVSATEHFLDRMRMHIAFDNDMHAHA